MKYAKGIAAAALIVLALSSVAYVLRLFPKGAATMEACMQKSVERFPGRVTWVEYLTSGGVRFYEFEIETAAGPAMNVECDAATGEIIEYSRHASVDDPEFAKAVSITAAQAKALALATKSGRVVSSEAYFHNDKEPYYEFDVITPQGREFKIEIDGARGAVTSVEDEAWEIGG